MPLPDLHPTDETTIDLQDLISIYHIFFKVANSIWGKPFRT
ncbi:Uncharacterised protein [Sphingobacterium multivorum]|uniref:Uncharacterized protein n=1 Tax=Sphingobacterium multivorum TaxID=28454 RepID=A0A2X2JX98_SPHMU|nr:Uncharacterised protein [Sphingobacterium multivorum]